MKKSQVLQTRRKRSKGKRWIGLPDYAFEETELFQARVIQLGVKLQK